MATDPRATATARLHDLGQIPWLDTLTRERLSRWARALAQAGRSTGALS